MGWARVRLRREEALYPTDLQHLANQLQPLFSLIDLGACYPARYFQGHSDNWIQHNLIAPYCTRSVRRGYLTANPASLAVAKLQRLLLASELPTSAAMPLVMSPCVRDDANDLAQAHLATFAYSASHSSKLYLKITDTSTDEVAAYAIWISVPPPPRPQRCKDDDRDPWLLSSSELVTTNNSNRGLCIGFRERLWSTCLYRGARVASKLRRFGLKARGVDRQCRKSVRMSVGSCVGLVGP